MSVLATALGSGVSSPVTALGSGVSSPAAALAAGLSLPADGASLAVFFLIGLLGGVHCLGMCGPLVTLYADELDRGRGPTFYEIRQHAAFNLGRTIAYATIGALMGGLGMLLFDAAAVLALAKGVRALAGLAIGAFIVAVGAGYLFRGSVAPTSLLGGLAGGGAFNRVYAALTGRVAAWTRGPRIVALGALHSALPCPLLYPAYLYALAQGSPAAGAANLAALGLGTFPTLFAYGTVVGSTPATWRRRLHRALGAAFLLLGYMPLSMGLRSLGVPMPMLPVPFYQPLG
ncbi:MAG: sulfite exporter TauE/SafE family protein [Halobacteriales archaeon]